MVAKALACVLTTALLSVPIVFQGDAALGASSDSKVVAVDEKGDWGDNGNLRVLGSAGAVAGMDLVKAKVQLENRRNLEFVLKLTDLPPLGSHSELPRYLWSMHVDGRQIELDGDFPALSGSDSTFAPFTVRADCVDRDGRVSCKELGVVQAELKSSTDSIKIPVPLDMVGAEPGSVIGAGSGHREWRPGKQIMAVPSAFAPVSDAPRDDMRVYAKFVVPGEPEPEIEPQPEPQPGSQPQPEPQPGSEPGPTTECSGTNVRPGQNLAGIVNAAPSGTTFCIHSGTYDLGSGSIQPKVDQRFIGDRVQIGPNGEIDAPTKIKGNAKDGVFFFKDRAPGVAIENLDISGATGTKDKSDSTTKKHGRGVNGGGKQPNVTIRYSRVHHNSNAGVGGIGPGSLLEHVELDNNGSKSYLGCCAGGVKSGKYYSIRNSYVHHNTGYGIWCDVGCEGGVWTIVDNLVTNNTVDGIRYEISMNDHGALIQRNVVRNNNTSNKIGGHGGITVVSSWNTLVSNNVLGGNGNAGIELKDDKRGSLKEVSVRKNQLNGDGVKGCDAQGASCGGS